MIALLGFIFGIRIVRPTQRGLIETLGKYTKFAQPGFHWIIPGIQQLYFINITEQMVNAEPQVIITNDNLNATVDAQVYFKVKTDEESVKNCQYNVANYQYQIVNLARTTLKKYYWYDVTAARQIVSVEELIMIYMKPWKGRL